MSERSGILYVCGTPIGNLEDATFRLIRVLREVDLIAAEDTRQTRRLCAHFGIHTPLVSCHERNEERRAVEILTLLEQGRSVAYVSDAGTPAVADPGARLVRCVRESGFRVVPVPGPSAVTTALSVAGYPADAFLVLGFLPRRGERREAALRRIADESLPIVLFEAPHRIQATLDDLAAILGRRSVWIGRELTKRFESTYAGPIDDVRRHVLADPVRGEYTLVIGPRPADAEAEHERLSEQARILPLAEEVALLVRAGLPEEEALRRVARAHGLTRRAVYRAVKVGDQTPR